MSLSKNTFGLVAYKVSDEFDRQGQRLYMRDGRRKFQEIQEARFEEWKYMAGARRLE